MQGIREWLMVTLFVIFLVLVFLFLFDDNPVSAQTEPPAEGDWVILDGTSKNETTIQLNGNLTIMEGGHLTLDNISIIFNCTHEGQFGIDIQKNAILNIYNSNISPSNSTHAFKFEVNGSMLMDRCNVSYPWGCNFTSSDVRVGGIFVYSDDVIIINSTISHTYGDGITCILASPTIINNTIRDTKDDGISCNYSSPDIIGNTFIDCKLGIFCYNDSAPFIFNNNISITISTYLTKGISITQSDRVIVINNTINNYDEGIQVKYCAPDMITENYLYNCGLNCYNSSPKFTSIVITKAGYGLECELFSNPILVNCSFIQSRYRDIWMSYESISNVTLINTSITYFSITTGSSIKNQWFAHVRVVDEWGNIVPGAEVIVNNSIESKENRTFITDENGEINWVLYTGLVRYSNNKNTYATLNMQVKKEGIGANWSSYAISESVLIVVVLRKDSDGDYVYDTEDAFPYNPSEWVDSDEDGLGDNGDLDDDNDGYLDEIESREGTNPYSNSSFPVDFDGDFDPDSSDPDDDNDNVDDYEDEFPYDPKEWRDSDGDGVGDNRDPDDNGNNISDAHELPLISFILILLILIFYFTNRSIKKKKESEKSD